MVGFWFLEVTSLLYIVMTLNFFISGHMLPLDLLPEPWCHGAQVPAVSLHGLFPGGRFPGEGEGNDARVFPGRRAGVDSFLHAAWRGSCTGLGCGVTAPSEVRRMALWRSFGRYFRLLFSLGRYTLYREMAFRGNFLVKVSVEVLWLAIMVAFFRTVFARTNNIAGWTEQQYFFFVGCFFAINGVIEMFFLDNCNEFAELVRTGDLDGLLLKPIDEQFLITCRRIDWGTAPNVLMGSAVMGISLYQMGWSFDLLRVATLCGVARVRDGDRIQLHAVLDFGFGVDGEESELDGNVVAVFERGAIPARDLRGPLGRSGPVLHVLHADSGGGERAGECDGACARTEDGGGFGRRVGDSSVAEPPVLSVCAAIVSKRE